MADSDIKSLTEKATGAATDEFVINDVAGGNVDKKMGMDGLRVTESQISDLQHIRSTTFTVAASDANDTTNADYICDGTADDVQIQAAIDALPAVGGSIVLSEGTFDISTELTLTSKLNLIGSGIGSTILKRNSSLTGSGANVITGTTVSYVTISNLTIDDNNAQVTTVSQNACLQFITNSNKIIIKNIEIKNIVQIGLSFGSTDDIEITGSYFTDAVSHFGIWCDTATTTNVRISKCVFKDNNLNGAFIANCENFIMSDCYFSGNAISTSGGQIDLDTDLVDAIITGCTFDNSGTNGGAIETHSNRTVITNNTIINQLNYGIRLKGDCNYITVSNNIIRDVTGPALDIEADVDNFILGNNICIDTGGGTQTYGIRIAAGTSNNYVISNNYMTGNVTANFSDGGTGTAKEIFGNIPITTNTTLKHDGTAAEITIVDSAGHIDFGGTPASAFSIRLSNNQRIAWRNSTNDGDITLRVGGGNGFVFTGDVSFNGNNLNYAGSVYLTEKAAAGSDTAGRGQIWVKTATPNELWFTDDAGTDHQIAFV